MKRILIMGYNSVLGNGLEKYLNEYNAKIGEEIYRVDKLSQRDEYWQSYQMSSYDVIFQATGIAHADTGKLTEEQKQAYYSVNCDLAEETARRAKEAGVKLFIYPSSAIVYGDSAPYKKEKMITESTPAQCAHAYGDSKIKAEEKLNALSDEHFKVAIMRLPMIYGKGCKGNYPLLAKMAGKSPIFPNVMNKRSMLYLENFCEFMRLLIEAEKGGLYFPQNEEYISTANMVKEIGKNHGKNIRLWGILNPFVSLACVMPGKIGAMANKAFGNLTYDKNLSNQDIQGYCLYSFEESIKRTES